MRNIVKSYSRVRARFFKSKLFVNISLMATWKESAIFRVILARCQRTRDFSEHFKLWTLNYIYTWYIYWQQTIYSDQKTAFAFYFYFFFLGWGRTIGGGSAAEVLQEALLPVADDETCRKKMKPVGKVYKKVMLCAGAQGKGGCQVKKGSFAI